MSIRDSIVRIILKGQDLLTPAARQAKKAANELDDSLKENKKSSEGLSQSLVSTAKNLVVLAGSYLGLRTLKDSLLSIINTGDKFEGLRAQLDAVMGSIEGGEQATQWIKQFTKETPLQLEEVTSGFLKLKAFGLDPMDGSYQAIVDQTSKLGGGQELLEGIILAVGQAWSKQKLQGEEILQLVERGVPVWDLLAKATGKNTQELQDLSSAGKLGRQEISLLVAEMGKASSGATQQQMSRISSIWSVIVDQATDFYNQIAQSGVMDYFREQLTKLRDTLTELAENGTLTEWAEKIGKSIVSAAEAFKSTLGIFENDAKKTAENVSSTFESISSKVGVAYNVIRIFTNGITSFFKTSVAGVAGFAGSLAKATTWLAEAVGFDSLKEKAQGLSDSLDKIMDDYLKTVEEDGKDIRAAWSAIVGGNTETTKQEGQRQVDAQKAINQQLIDEAEKAEAHYQQLQDKARQAAQNTEAAFAQVASTTGEARVKAMEQVHQAISEQAGLDKEVMAAAEQAVQKRKAAEDALPPAIAKTTDAIREQQTVIQNGNQFFSGGINGIRSGYADATQSINEASDAIKRANALTADADKQSQQHTETIKDQNSERQRLLVANYDHLQTTEQVEAAEAELDAALQKGTITAGEYEVQIGKLNERGEELKITFGSSLAAIINATTQSMFALSEAAGQAFESVQFGNRAVGEIDAVRASLQQAAQEADHYASAQSHVMNSSFSRYFAELYGNAARVKEAFYQQKLELVDLTSRINSGAYSLAQLNGIAATAGRKFDLLDDSDLSSLISQIDRARQAIQSLDDSATSTLINLKNELDQLEGNQQAIEQRNYERERERLLAELENARAIGAKSAAADYQEALRVLEELHKKKMANLKAEQTANAKQTNESAKNKTPEYTPSPSLQKYQVELISGDKRVTVETENGAELLELLESYKLRSV